MENDQEFFSQLADEQLFAGEGQLSVDVVESHDEILVRSAIAGVEVGDLDITVTPDTVTIRGKREHGCETRDDEMVHVEECFWGAFSRSVVLPHAVRPENADASLKNGILTIRLKKAEMRNRIDVVKT
jgi:HSP20 family protein